MTKLKSPHIKPVFPLRLNLNLRIKQGKDWTHYKGLSFICEARDRDEAEAFALRLKSAAQQIAVEMRLTIPGATIIYVPEKAADSGLSESTAPANQAETRA
jgi:hypothetical protein